MDKESESLIREWLAKYKGLRESSIPEYAESILKEEKVLDALMKLFTPAPGQDELQSDLMQPVCHQLFEFYRSRFSDLKHFTMNLFPAIILSHIVSVSSDSTSTDTLLLSIYALSSQNSSPEESLEIPQLGLSSIYHDPMSGIFSEQILNIQTPNRRFYQKPVLPNHQAIIPSNRFQILTSVLNVYLEHIAIMKKKSHLNLCETCKFLASSGYQWKNKYLPNSEKLANQRYNLSVDFMLRMLRCVYFAMYNQCWSDALKATEAMHRRARKEMIPQVLFLSNAILNSANEQNEGVDIGFKTSPYGLTSANLTPMLARESSRKGGRYAATAKSIKDHKWRHHNEEISGDLTRSFASSEIQCHPPKLGQEVEESGKVEKYSTPSPSKLLKSKLKKSASGSPGMPEKAKSPAPSTGEKKNKKISTDKSGEEIELEKIRKSPSQRKESSAKVANKGVQKHPSMDETSLTPKLKGVTASKSSSDVGKSSVSAIPRQLSVSGKQTHPTPYAVAVGAGEDFPYADDDAPTALFQNGGMKGKIPRQVSSAGEEGDYSVPLLDSQKQDAARSSESDSRDSFPLLKNSESPSRSKTSNQQTAF